MLTVFVSAEMRLGLDAGVGLASLVDRDDSELVPLSETEAGDAGLELLDGGRAVGVVGHEGVEPAAEGVLLLNDVVRYGSAAVVGGGRPAQGHRLMVEIHDLGISGFTRRG